MDTPPIPSQKKGLGVFGWLGLGCGALIVILIIIGVVGYFFLAPKAKQLGEDYKKDPTRAMANTMVSVSMGQFEMVKEDQANKRYTLRAKGNGQLTTIYWDAKKQAPMTVQGDFSAIPADANSPATPAPQ